jgi:hypothetical protein
LTGLIEYKQTKEDSAANPGSSLHLAQCQPVVSDL